MKPLDDFDIWHERLINENTSDAAFDFEESKIQLKELLEAPVDKYPPVFSWYIRSKWSDVFKRIKASAPIEVLELASGASAHIPNVIAKHYENPRTKYTTFNLNKKLTASFKSSTSKLPITIDVVEDAAQNISDHIGKNKMDAVVFEHAINDILQGMFAERNGIDTINTDWFDILPEMVKIISAEYRNKTFEDVVKNEFTELLNSCFNVLKPGGVMVFFHHLYQSDLDLGYDVDLYENIVDIARKWIHEAKIGKEVFFDGFEPHWWMFIQKI